MKKWFEVDKQGLSKIMSRKNKSFILFELIQNAWDENSSKVEVNIFKQKNSKMVNVEIKDDNPEGFLDLAHAFTLFAESNKKSNPEKRGRFNLGEKLVLSLCHEAKITSTKGTIEFTSIGRKSTRNKTNGGTIFEATIKMTSQEMEEAIKSIHNLIPPREIDTYINGKIISSKKPIKQ